MDRVQPILPFPMDRATNNASIFSIFPIVNMAFPLVLFFIILLIRTFQFRIGNIESHSQLLCCVARFEWFSTFRCCCCCRRRDVWCGCFKFPSSSIVFHFLLHTFLWCCWQLKNRYETIHKELWAPENWRNMLTNQTRYKQSYNAHSQRHSRNRKTCQRKRQKSWKWDSTENTSKSQSSFVNATLSYPICFFPFCIQSTFVIRPCVRVRVRVSFFKIIIIIATGVCVWIVWDAGMNDTHSLDRNKINKNRKRKKNEMQNVMRYARTENIYRISNDRDRSYRATADTPLSLIICLCHFIIYLLSKVRLGR